MPRPLDTRPIDRPTISTDAGIAPSTESGTCHACGVAWEEIQ